MDEFWNLAPRRCRRARCLHRRRTFSRGGGDRSHAARARRSRWNAAPCHVPSRTVCWNVCKSRRKRARGGIPQRSAGAHRRKDAAVPCLPGAGHGEWHDPVPRITAPCQRREAYLARLLGDGREGCRVRGCAELVLRGLERIGGDAHAAHGRVLRADLVSRRWTPLDRWRGCHHP